MTAPIFNINSIAMNFDGIKPLLLFLMIVSSALLSFWYYRGAVPSPKKWVGVILFSLRFCAFALILFTAAEPIIRIIRTEHRVSQTAIMLDTSSSMDSAGDVSRKKDALEVISKLRERNIKNCVFYGFDTGMKYLKPGEPVFQGNSTDISAALEKISEQKDVSSVILISDGRWNIGKNPAEIKLTGNIRVDTILTGEPLESGDDIFIKGISAPLVVKEGTNIEGEIEIEYSGNNPGKVPFNISAGNKKVFSGEVILSPDIKGGNASFSIPAGRPGEYVFKASAQPSFDGVKENNARTFGVKVVKNRFNIILAGALPSPDFAFIKRALEQTGNFKVTPVLGAAVPHDTENRLPIDFSGTDAIILLDWGGNLLKDDTADKISAYVRNGGALWFISASRPSTGAQMKLAAVLPVRFTGAYTGNAGDFSIALTEKGELHYITAGTYGNIRNGWLNLPPVKDVAAVEIIAGMGEILARANSKTVSVPAIVTGAAGSGKVTAMFFKGLWRWKMLKEAETGRGGFFESLAAGAAGWLTADNLSSPLVVKPGAQSYLNGDEAVFSGQLFDNVYSPVSGAEIAMVIDGDLSKKIAFREVSPALYESKARGLPPGKHTYKASAYLSGKLFAETSGEVTVDEFSLEMADKTTALGDLGIIAHNTGGLAITAAGADSVISRISPAEISERIKNEHRLSLNPLFPLIIIILLTAEWSIRKITGMI